MTGSPDTKHISEGRYEEVMRNRAIYGDQASPGRPVFQRYVILEVISDPSTLDSAKLSYFEHELGVANIALASVAPRNSIIARHVMAAGSSASEKVMCLYPFCPPHMAMPAKPGEHVWVMFEHPDAKESEIGYWLWRITQPSFVEDVNYTHADRQFDKSFLPGISSIFEGTDAPTYEFRNGAVDDRNGQRYTIGGTISLPGDDKTYEDLLQNTDASKLIRYEAVPRFRKRPADLAWEGSNNQLIVFGTDRVGAVSDYDVDPDKGKIPKPLAKDVATKGAGSISLIVGRGQTSDTAGKLEKNKLISGGDLYEELGKTKKDLAETEGDPDIINDRSSFIVSQKTKVDTNLQISDYLNKPTVDGTSKGVAPDGDGAGAIVLRTDKLRIIARSDVVIMVEGAKDKDENGNLKSGSDSSKWASVTIKSNGDIVFTPSDTGLIRLGGDDASLSPLCTRVGNSPGMKGPVPPPPPIVDTMGGAQGAQGALNGEFATRVLFK